MTSTSDYVMLSAGNRMPIHGLGLWLAKPEETEQAVDVALQAGYRLLDTALAYGNEQAIGKSLQRHFQSEKLKRENIFITTKVAAWCMESPEKIREAFNASLSALQLEYVDLYLIHHAVGFTPSRETLSRYDHIAAWKTLEELVDEGKVRAIGLSNFNSKQIEHIRASARIPISNLQVECHLYFQQKELFQFCQERNITLTAYAPLGSPGRPSRSLTTTDVPLHDPTVLQLAKKYNKTPAQILLKHLMQRGIAVIPKSTNSGRIKENIDVFDFTLSEEDVNTLSNTTICERFFTMTAVKGATDHPDYPFRIPY